MRKRSRLVVNKASDDNGRAALSHPVEGRGAQLRPTGRRSRAPRFAAVDCWSKTVRMARDGAKPRASAMSRALTRGGRVSVSTEAPFHR